MSESPVIKEPQPRSGHLYFVQWLRVALISLVVAHHAAQPYGPTGGDWPIDDPASSNLLGVFFLFNSALGMGFFFFLSGYFVSGSYERKGGIAFTRERIFRLGMPLIFGVLLLFGPIVYLESGSEAGFLEFLVFDYIGHWQIEMGHLWFISQLLALSISYACWRKLMSARGASSPSVLPVPSTRTILIYVLILGFAGMIVRSVYQQDFWVDILGVIPVEPVHAPQYWSLFFIGIIAGRNKWLENMPSSVGSKWLTAGLTAFFIALATQPNGYMLPNGMWPDAIAPGEKQWGILWGLLEAFVCVGLIISISIFLRDRFSFENAWIKRLDGNVFGVYFFHVFIVVGLQGAILGFALPALEKFAIVAVVGVMLSFLSAGLFRLIPGVRRLL